MSGSRDEAFLDVVSDRSNRRPGRAAEFLDRIAGVAVAKPSTVVPGRCEGGSADLDIRRVEDRHDSRFIESDHHT